MGVEFDRTQCNSPDVFHFLMQWRGHMGTADYPNSRWWVEVVVWWRNLRAGLARFNELDGGTLGIIAKDVGLSAGQLQTVAARGPNAADQVQLRLEALHLHDSTVSGDVMRDLERVCTVCDSKRKCKRDFVHFPDDAAWEAYCPNASTFDALKAGSAV
jgi:hypothetical protein